MKRLLSPALNPAGLHALAALAFALAQVVAYHRPVASPLVLLPLASLVAALLTRTQVTPVADPRDGNGKPLAAAPPGAAP